MKPYNFNVYKDKKLKKLYYLACTFTTLKATN